MESRGDLLKFSAAVQITRPKSVSSHQGFSSSPNSPKQMKVAQLVLKKSVEQSQSPSAIKVPPPMKSTRGDFIERSKSDVDHKASNFMSHLMMSKTSTTTVKIDLKEDDRNGKSSIYVSATKQQKQPQQRPAVKTFVVADESPHIHKSSMVNEAVRKEAREFMKKQKERRKQLDDETKKEEDKSFIIKQRLAQLKITTRNVIANANKVPLSKPVRAGADEIENSHEVSRQKKYTTYREIHTLKLKPMSRKSQSSSNEIMNKSHDKPNNSDSDDDHKDTPPPEVKEILQLQKTQCGILREESEMEVNPKQASPSAATFPASPVKKTLTLQKSLKKLVSPLQLQNHQLHATTKLDIAQHETTTTVNGDNKKSSIDDMKLKIPDVKLNITPLTRQEIVPSHYKMKTPAWLQSSFTHPYPYNFIFAVKKKLEAYISNEELCKRKIAKKQQAKVQRTATTRKKKQNDESEEMNTMSEISSIQSDLVLMRSQRSSEESPHNQKRVGGDAKAEHKTNDDDDTTISISLSSVKNEIFVGKKRESVNSEFERHDSFPLKNEDDLTIEDISPNTSEKQENFLSSTKIEKSSPPHLNVLAFKKPDIPALKKPQVHQSDNDNHNSSHGKENDYRKILDAFHNGLSQVIEVNNQLSSTVIDGVSKPSSVTSTTSTAKSYSTQFEKALDTESSNVTSSHRDETDENEADNRESSKLGESSSIETFIESETLREKTIDDPIFIVNDTQREVKNNETTSQMTSTFVTKDDDDIKEQTLNESKILNILQLNDINIISFDVNSNLDNYDEMFLKNNKSTKEIHSWEKKLIDRMKGEIAWLELNKQNLKKHGHFEKAALMRNLQRTLLLRLEKEREKLKNATNSAIIESSNDNEESVTKSEIERVLEQRENKLILKRKQIERLVKWQQKLDHEEERLRNIEQQLLGKNLKKISSSKELQKENENDLNISIEKVRSIDKSLEILQNIPSSEDQPETVKVSGAKLNKLWRRLTGSPTPKFDSDEILSFTKEKFSDLYEEARQFVLYNEFDKVLEISNLSVHSYVEINDEKLLPEWREKKQEEEIDKDDGDDNDDEKSESTMNSIANIETEEEYPGSYQEAIETEVTSSTRKNESSESGVLLEIPKLDNLTFAITPKAQQSKQPQQIEDLNQSNLSVGLGEMEVEKDSNQTSIPNSFEKIESSSVDINGSIIPENVDANSNIQITDMDDSIEQEDQLIEDISFPDYENSISIQESEQNARNNLSTITECTEYEQSQGSSEIYTDYGTATTSTSTSSESKNVEIQNRLISINDSLTDVSEAFDRAVKPLSLAKMNSAETTASSTSKSSEENNTIQFSEHDILRHSTGEEDDKKSESNGSTSDF